MQIPLATDHIVNVGWIHVEDAGERKVKILQMHPADARILGQQTQPRPTPLAMPGGQKMMQAMIVPPTHARILSDEEITHDRGKAFCKIDNVLIWLWEGEDEGEKEN